MNMKRADIVVGAVLCLLSLVVFVYAGQYRGAGVSQYGPNFFPQVLAFLMFVSALVMIIRALRGKALDIKEIIDHKGFRRAAAVLGITVVYLLVMQVLGFVLPTIAFLYVLMTSVGHGGRVVKAVSSVAVTAIVYGIFFLFLRVPAPEGIFPWLL